MDDVTWRLLVYRLPPQPSSKRVAVWRELRRLGAVSLQQSCVVLPDTKETAERLDVIVARVRAGGGTHYLFTLRDLGPEMQARLRDRWNELRSEDYAELVKECETKFRRQIEFEIFRDNLTAAQAEELEADLDKLRRRLARIVKRDHFAASGKAEAQQAIEACRQALEDFTEQVYLRESDDNPAVTASGDRSERSPQDGAGADDTATEPRGARHS